MQPGLISRAPTVAQVKEELNEIAKSRLFRHAPTLRRLLEYVCHKVLLEEGSAISEYTIALDVFGKPSNFKESKDSGVRVEAYRLRRRLAQFYETEGRGHAIRIVVPPGRYAPEFLFTDTSVDTPAEVAGPVALAKEPGGRAPKHAAQLNKRRILIGLACATVIVAVVLLAEWIYKQRPQEQRSTILNPVPVHTQSAATGASTSAAIAPIRIMAGYRGPTRRDISGMEWGPDRFFRGGRPFRYDIPRVGRTNDPLRFQFARIGDSAYDIPLADGNYELHLYFIEPEFGPEVGRGENDRTFFLHINDERLLPAIDVESDAKGPNIADERVYKGVHPSADGKLHLSLESATGVPLLNAIEILPGLPNKQLPVRLVAHRVPFTDHSGQVWRADDYYLNGQTCPRDAVVAGTPDPSLFTLERYGHFDYAIPVDVRGVYTVELHFAELYFGPSAAGHGGVGSRVFNVTCNGILLFQNLDVFKEVGYGRALTKASYHIRPTAQGKLNIDFQPVVNYGVIFGIEVFDESS